MNFQSFLAVESIINGNIDSLILQQAIFDISGAEPVKNYLPPRSVGTIYDYGVNFVTREDGRVSASGTAASGNNAQMLIPMGTIPAGDYVLQGCPNGGSIQTWLMYIWDNNLNNGKGGRPDGNPGNNDYGSGLYFTAIENHNYTAVLRVVSGQTVQGLIFEPMITESINAGAPYVKG